MAKFWFEHPTDFLTADVRWKAKLSCPSSTASYAHGSLKTHMACVAWCGIGHQELRICNPERITFPGAVHHPNTVCKGHYIQQYVPLGWHSLSMESSDLTGSRMTTSRP